MSTTLLSSVPPSVVREKPFIARRLRELRLQAGMSQEALARRANLSLSTIQHLEQGRRGTPSFATVMKVCAGLGVPAMAFQLPLVKPPAAEVH